MKKMILSLAFAGTLILAASACNSTKNVSGSADSTAPDSIAKMAPAQDSIMKDTTKTTPPDTSKAPKM